MRDKRILRNVSLARALSKLGRSSRKEAEKLIRSGEVKVNRVVVRETSFRCSLDADVISVAGRVVAAKKFIYIMMNKPAGVVTTRSDERGRTTVYDVLGDVGTWLFPVGRLDKETSGLLLLTNDNRLGERLTNPSSKIPKTYLVELDHPLEAKHAKLIENGLTLDDELLLPAVIGTQQGNTFEITIVEGKNRQVRRMCEALGYEVVSLTRVGIGSYTLQLLGKSVWKKMSRAEVERLLVG